jgi:indolepyruvate ferredoxin oxidoreductase beta subunit
MKFDLVFCGVGGQGILSIAYVLDHAALQLGLRFKQSEVHGMAQRGGAVSSHLRVSDREIFSDVVPLGAADLLLGVEPMETLRYLGFLAGEGQVVSSTTPEVNIPDYPEMARILDALLARPGVTLLNGRKVARDAGSHRAQNMALLGAASPFLPIPGDVLERFVGALFERKGERVVQTNLDAFRFGREAGELFRRCVDAGAEPRAVLGLMDHLESSTLEAGAAELWCEVLAAPAGATLEQLWRDEPRRTIPGGAATARQLLAGVDALPAA